jgi:hypothetical protein
MSGDVRNFNDIETRDVIYIVVFFFLQDKVQKEIHAILTETLGKHASFYGTVKYWVASLNVVIFHLSCASSWMTTQTRDHPADY